MEAEARELWGSGIPVTPVFVVLDRGRARRIVDAFDQEPRMKVVDLAEDLVELACTMGRAIDVEVEQGRWVRVRPDGTMASTGRPTSLKRVAVVKRRAARRRARQAACEALAAFVRMKLGRHRRLGRPPARARRTGPPRHRRPGGALDRFRIPGLVGGQGAPGGSRRGRVRSVSAARTA